MMAGERFIDQYASALETLTFNSKPIINQLTTMADENKAHATEIVEKIESRIKEVPPEQKLPSLYLLDSILKNVGSEYITHFNKNIVHLFCHVFEKLSDPKSRMALYKLRQTWGPYFQVSKLGAIDKHIHDALDPNWPITAAATGPKDSAIFVNPKFLESHEKRTADKTQLPAVTPEVNQPSVSQEDVSIGDKRKQLLEQQRQKKAEHVKALGINSLENTKGKAPPPPTPPSPPPPSPPRRRYRPARHRGDWGEEPPAKRQPWPDERLLPGERFPPEERFRSMERRPPAPLRPRGDWGEEPPAKRYPWPDERLLPGERFPPEERFRSMERRPPAPAPPPPPPPDRFLPQERWMAPPEGPPPMEHVPERFLGPPQLPLPPPQTQPSAPVPVTQLFEKLLKVGLVPGGDGGMGEGAVYPPVPKDPPPPPRPYRINVPELSFTPATLKQRYNSLVTLLHAGEPCASCGLRFLEGSGEEYRKHLDWHYRMNRKDKNANRKTFRNWFLHPEDWLKYEEKEDLQENESVHTLEPEVVEEEFSKEAASTSCKVLPGEGSEVCASCDEPFEQFWEEDLEEWHFKDAIRLPDGRLYHIFCYKDVKEGNQQSRESQPTKTEHPGN